MILIFFGPPGAGKGTQANLIANYLDIPHLSTGNIFREKLLENDAISKKIKNILDSGQLISDTITNEVIYERLKNNDCSNGFILDGYPRTLSQANFLEKVLNNQNKNIDFVIDILIDEKVIFQRIKSRSNIENRADDNEEVVKTRIENYLEETKPLSDFYLNRYPSGYHKIMGNQDIEKINKDILKIVGKS